MRKGKGGASRMSEEVCEDLTREEDVLYSPPDEQPRPKGQAVNFEGPLTIL